MTIARFLPRHRSLMVLLLTALFGALAVQSVAAQSNTPSSTVSIAEAGDMEDELVQTTLPRRSRPSAVPLSPQSLADAPGDTPGESSVPASIRLQTTSLRGALLHGVSVETEADRSILRRDFASPQALSAESSVPSSRQTFLGMSKDGSLAVGANATNRRNPSPRVSVPKDRLDSSRHGMLLMSIDF